MADSFHDEEVLGKAYDSRLMRRLLVYLRPYWRMTLFALVAILLFGILQAVPPYLLKVEVDRYLDPTARAELPKFLSSFLSPNPLVGITQIALILFLPAAVLTFCLEFAQSFAMQLVGQRVMYDMRKQLFAHLQRLQMSFFDRNPVGRLVTRVTTDVDVLNDLFASGVVAIFGDIFSLFSIVVVMLKMDYKLALLTFSVLPIIVLVTAAFRKAVRESYRRIRVAIARINAYLQEHITGMTVLQLFNREERSFQEFEKINRAHMEAYKDSILAYGLFYPAVELLGMIAVAIILYLGGGMALRGLVTVGTAIAFIQYSQRFFRPIQDLSDKYNLLQAAMASSERIFKLLDTPVTIADPVGEAFRASRRQCRLRRGSEGLFSCWQQLCCGRGKRERRALPYQVLEALSNSVTWASRTGMSTACWKMSRSRSNPGRRSRWWVTPAPARPRLPICCFVSTTCKKGRCCLTAWTSAICGCEICEAISASSSRTPSCFREPSPAIFVWAASGSKTSKSVKLHARWASWNSSRVCQEVFRNPSKSAALRFQWVRSNCSPLLERSLTTQES